MQVGDIFQYSLHAQMNLLRSHCARGLHIAGPLERFSIRNCMAVWSVTNPIYPPKASISRTICPLAMPPTAGLQLICPILFISIVIRQVFEPGFAAAAAASHPACPAPITITSCLNSIRSVYFKTVQSYEKVVCQDVSYLKTGYIFFGIAYISASSIILIAWNA